MTMKTTLTNLCAEEATMELSPEYTAALEKSNEASAIFRAIKDKYRARKIDDAEYCAAFAVMKAANLEFDAASAKEAEAFNAIPKIQFTDNGHGIVFSVREHAGLKKPTRRELADYVRDNMPKLKRRVPSTRRIKDLESAIDGLLLLIKLPGENQVDAYERTARAFKAETGLMAPGKDEAPAVNSGDTQEERREAYHQWTSGKIKAALLSLPDAVDGEGK